MAFTPRETKKKIKAGYKTLYIKDDLAEKMLMLYNDKPLRERLAEAGNARAEKYFDRPIMLNNILRDMNEIMGVNERG